MSASRYRDLFVEALGFGLDAFQSDALDALDQGVNVLVSAPTGSGKTIVANYAIGQALEREQRSFYTTPLKALSNQKYHELCNLYGTSRVGLLTGDTSINRLAPVVVMTTEVLRNMLLTESDQLRDLGLVVLDEVHYLQDPFRGGVWEEVLILTPSSVRFVALSATIGNADFLGEWFEVVRGTTSVIVESTRPIELHNHVAVVPRSSGQVEILDLLDGARLSDAARRVDNLMKSSRKFRPGPKWHGPHSSAPPPAFRAPRRSELLRAAADADLLPIIVFIFSRAACDDAVQQCRRDGLLFTTPEERRAIDAIANERVRDFEENLLAVVFATETLALGVNMPARSVALERFTKYSDNGRQFLTSGEFAQMTGRAGRRGLDDEGHALVCFTPDLALHDVARVALAAPSELHSSFRPTYNLTANLINHVEFETAIEIVRQSFAQFEADHRPRGSRRPLSEQLIARHRVLEELGYAKDWSLTEHGQLLRSIYHECDLLIAESLNLGVFDDLEPAQLAGLLSTFVFEAKRSTKANAAKQVSTKKRRAINDRLGPQRRGTLSERQNEITALSIAIFDVEARHQVPHTKEPDGRFATTIAAWARGATLSTVLDLAELEIGQTSPGDFVRQAKQVVDLCEQFSRMDDRYGVAQAAGEARDLVLRSVVAGTSSVHPPR
ncbi:MAG: hypothetical protein B7X07_03835 [Actinobacteria bacterium 21-64-8]|nr:MAG: hypothetical protein B7X07_03835 [Actinobacteria bacterium 21-64-8]